MDLELNGSVVAGWAIAATVGFVAGAVAFYAPQPARVTGDGTTPQTTTQSSVGSGVVPTLTHSPATQMYEAAGSPPSHAAPVDTAGVPGAQTVAPPYGAAAGDRPSASSSSGNLGYLPPSVTNAAGEASSLAGTSLGSASTTSIPQARQEPVLNVGGYLIQGDSVVSVPPSHDPRREYRMSIDVSKLP